MVPWGGHPVGALGGGHAVGALEVTHPVGALGGHPVGVSVWVGLQLQTTSSDRVSHKTKQNSPVSLKKDPKKQSHFQFYSS